MERTNKTDKETLNFEDQSELIEKSIRFLFLCKNLKNNFKMIHFYSPDRDRKN